MDGNLIDYYTRHLTIDNLYEGYKSCCEFLVDLHSLDLFHNDIKPENILYKNIDGKVIFKIGDYGFLSSYDKVEGKGILLNVIYKTPLLWQDQEAFMRHENVPKFITQRKIVIQNHSKKLDFLNDIFRNEDELKTKYRINDFYALGVSFYTCIYELNKQKHIDNFYNEMILLHEHDGGAPPKIKYGKQHYQVYCNQKGDKYINVLRKRTYLRDIRGQYRYVKS